MFHVIDWAFKVNNEFIINDRDIELRNVKQSKNNSVTKHKYLVSVSKPDNETKYKTLQLQYFLL